MATTGELSTIMEELELVDIGDAASYLGEEAFGVDDGMEVTLKLSACLGGKVNDEFAYSIA